ncbi:MAG: NAD(P)-dependent oxidoreductase [Pseudomonadota bacterium]
MTTILMTGAAGGVGTQLRPYLKQMFDRVMLSDIKPIDDLADNEAFVRADLGDMAALEGVCDGIHGVIHLGGQPNEADWETMLERNLVGCYNLFEAARRKNVKRIVFASSNHAIGFYPRRRLINEDNRVRPDTRYGVSKAFGEALGSLYADKYGMGVMSIRIGNVDYKPADKRRMSIWIHPEDLAQLCQIAMNHPEMHNEVVFGNSHCERNWWDNKAAYALGYRPKHHAEDHVNHAMAEQAKLGDDPIGDRFHGGGFCAIEFTGDIDRF